MNTPISFEDLDQMAGEVLPDRTVLSVIVTPPGGGGAISDGGGGGATMLSACTTTTTYYEPGVVGLVGVGLNKTPITTVTCTPAAVASY